MLRFIILRGQTVNGILYGFKIAAAILCHYDLCLRSTLLYCKERAPHQDHVFYIF
jgi:hypothetical protein